MKKKFSLILAIALCLSLTACVDQNGGERSEETPVGNGADPQTEWSVKTQEIDPFGPGHTVSGAARLGDRLLLCGETEGDRSEPILGLIRYTVENDGSVSVSETQILEFDALDGVDETMIYGITAGGDGYFYVLLGERFSIYQNPDFEIGENLWLENPDYEGRYSILKFTEDGELLEQIMIRDWPYSSIEGIAVGNEGELVLYRAGHLFLMDRNGEILNTESAGEGIYFQSVSNCGAGLIASTHETSQLKGTYYQINSQNGLLFELNIPGEYERHTVDTGNWAVTQGLDGEFLVCNTIGIHGYQSFYVLDFDEQTCQEIFRWRPEQGVIAKCTYACRLAEDTFAYTTGDGERLYVVTADKQETQGSAGRTVVKVAVYGSEGETRARLNALNAAGGSYFYECTTYSANQRDLLMTEISTGNAPDLVLFSAGQYNGEPLDTNSDYFEDLYAYLDSDPELSRESFIPNLLETISTDGRLTQLCQYATIYSIIVRTSDTGDSKTLAAEDYMKILKKNEEYTAVFAPWMPKEGLLDWAATLSCSAYIDKGNAACNFDNKEFSGLLQWVKAAGSDYKGSDPMPEMIYSEYVANLSMINTPHRIQGDKVLFSEPVTYVGFPIGDDPGNIYYCEGTSMAIPAFGSNKDGAWEYIRTQLSFAAQYNSQAEDLFPKIPVNLEAAKRLAAEVLTEEEVDELLDLMSHTKYAENYTDDPLHEIITTCGAAYLAGDKTLEETVDLIQSRASVYMAEKYG